MSKRVQDIGKSFFKGGMIGAATDAASQLGTGLSNKLGAKEFLDDIAENTGSGLRNEEGQRAAEEAAQNQADYLNRALDYQMQQEELPSQFRNEALSAYGNLLGLGDGGGQLFNQQQMIDDARSSPIYEAILGTQGASEDAIMRNAGATGGLRSGNVQSNLAKNAQQLQQEALMQGYNQQLGQRNQYLSGLQGMARLPSNANQIANTMGNIGQTLSQGQIAAAQAKQAGIGTALNLLSSAGNSAAAAYSDIRLKDNVELIDKKDGHNWYSWTWNDEAGKLGLSGPDSGVMAHELADSNPELVGLSNGYLTVNYGGINA